MSTPMRTTTRSAGTRGAIRARSSRPLIYLSANPDVKAAGVNPLEHFDQIGWQEGRVPSLAFDLRAVSRGQSGRRGRACRSARALPAVGASEGRQPFAPSELIAANGFDYVYYLQHNPDVAAAHVDPLPALPDRRLEGGPRSERAVRHGRAISRPTRTSRPRASIRSITITQFGWHEGRDPSVDFDTTAYLAAYPDVAAAQRRSAAALPRSSASTKAARRRRMACGGRTSRASAVGLRTTQVP